MEILTLDVDPKTTEGKFISYLHKKYEMHTHLLKNLDKLFKKEEVKLFYVEFPLNKVVDGEAVECFGDLFFDTDSASKYADKILDEDENEKYREGVIKQTSIAELAQFI